MELLKLITIIFLSNCLIVTTGYAYQIQNKLDTMSNNFYKQFLEWLKADPNNMKTNQPRKINSASDNQIADHSFNRPLNSNTFNKKKTACTRFEGFEMNCVDQANLFKSNNFSNNRASNKTSKNDQLNDKADKKTEKKINKKQKLDNKIDSVDELIKNEQSKEDSADKLLQDKPIRNEPINKLNEKKPTEEDSVDNLIKNKKLKEDSVDKLIENKPIRDDLNKMATDKMAANKSVLSNVELFNNFTESINDLKEDNKMDENETEMIETSFNCEGKLYGYYVDIYNNCTVFHICNEDKMDSFKCPSNLVFNQLSITCTEEKDLVVPCAQQEIFFAKLHPVSTTNIPEPTELNDNKIDEIETPSPLSL